MEIKLHCVGTFFYKHYTFMPSNKHRYFVSEQEFYLKINQIHKEVKNLCTIVDRVSTI